MSVHLNAPPGGTLVNHTLLYTRVEGGPLVGSAYNYTTLPDAERSTTQPLKVHATAAPGRWTGLFVTADSLQVDVADASGPLRLADSTRSVDSYAPKHLLHHTHREALRPAHDGPALTLTGDLAFTFQSIGNQTVEWHEVRVSCPGEPCPDGAHATTLQRPGDEGGVLVQQLPYVETIFQGSLHGNGTAQAIILGGPILDLSIDGRVRLPGASRLKGCADCTALDGTLSLEGNITLSGLQSHGRSLAASISGTYTGARLDESSIDPATVGGVPLAAEVAIAAGGLTLAYLLVRLAPLASALLVRDHGEPRNDNRRRILAHIRDHPGVTFNQLRRTLALSKSTVEHHIHVLMRSGLVVRHRLATTHHYYENHGRYDATDQHTLAILRDDHLRLLLLLLQRLGRTTRVEVIRHAFQEYQWAPSTTQDRLQRLANEGLAHTGRVRGRRWYEASAWTPQED